MFCLCVGAASIIFWPTLPQLWLLGFCFACLLCIFFLGWWRVHVVAALAFCAGALWMSTFFTLHLHWLHQLTPTPQTFSALVHDKLNNNRVVLKLETQEEQILWPKPLVVVTFANITYLKTPVEIGDRFQIKATFQPVHGFSNQGGFLIERWLLGKGVSATAEDVLCLSHQPQGESRLRNRLLARFQEALQPLRHAGIFTALVFGDRSAIPFSVRELFKQAGLAHLLVISGLHIGLIAGLIFTVLRPWCSYRTTALLVCLASWCYTALAGFSPPTQRALYFVILMMIAQGVGRSWPKSSLLMVCFLGIVILDGWTVFSMSFWLSFVAISAVFLCHHLWPSMHFMWFQVRLGMLLLPVQTLFFSGISLVSIIINLIAVPLFCLFIIPCALLCSAMLMLYQPLSRLGFSALDGILQWFIHGLSIVGERIPLWMDVPSQMRIFFWLLLSLVFAQYFGARKIFFGVVTTLGGLIMLQSQPKSQIHIFDVGAFNAVLVQSGKQSILYENMLGYPQGLICFRQQVLPALKALQVKEIALLIHQSRGNPRLDLARLKLDFPVHQVWTNQDKLPEMTPCHRGLTQEIGDMKLEVLWPYIATTTQTNCLVKVSNQQTSVLLSDYLSPREIQLLQQWPDVDLRADLWVLSGYHISDELIQLVMPKSVVQSAPWSLTYQPMLGRQQFWTGRDGQLSFSLDLPMKSQILREKQPWYARLHRVLGASGNSS